MRRFFRKETDDSVDELIEAVLRQMEREGPGSEKYSTLMSYLERLNELKAKDRPDSVSRDTLAVILGNFAIALLIVAYEQKHVITSKGFNQFLRPKGQTPN